MDDQQFDQMMQSLGGSQGNPSAPPADTPAPPSTGAPPDPSAITATNNTAAVQPPGAAAPTDAAPAPDPATPDASQPPSQPQAPPPPGAIGDAILRAHDAGGDQGRLYMDMGLGAAKAVFQTSDFVKSLFGVEHDPTQDSALRKDLENTAAQIENRSTADSFVIGLSQFATGMLGAGKITAPLKAIGIVGDLAAAAPKVTQAIEGAAASGAVFDPHGQRLSNIIQSFPALQNPITGYLAASPDDSAAEGRLKSALESLGIEATVGPVLLGATKLYKALAGGDEAAAAAAKAETQAAIEKQPEVPSPEANSEAPPQDATDATVTNQPNVTAASEGAPPAAKLPPISDEQVKALVSSMKMDDVVVSEAGSWQAALDAGHTFSSPNEVPWAKMGTAPDQMQAFIQRVADEVSTSTQEARGGTVGADGIAVQHDADVLATAQRMADIYEQDPSAVLGWLQRSAANAPQMAADMHASLLIAKKGFGDLYANSLKYQAGILDQWGGDPVVAAESLRRSLSAVTAAYNYGKSLLAAAGRTTRFAGLALPDMNTLGQMNVDELAQAIIGTRGDPAAMAKLTQPSMWQRLGNWATFLQANNLLWGWKTSVTIAATNAYLGLVRPAERMIGSFFVKDGSALRQEALKQYYYMGSALTDSFMSAKEAFLSGQSQLVPHAYEAANNVRHTDLTQPGVWQDWGTLSGLVTNTFTGLKQMLSLPTRGHTGNTEFWQQIAYRSKVMAEANVDGTAQGLTGPDLVNYVKQKLNDALDENGAAIDPAARQEALTATFQQQLLPKTLGSVVQQGANALPGARIVLPFIRTPANLMRYGWKMTPGLNMLQTEYRSMVMGEMGDVAKAQALGQMGLGTLFSGMAAYLWAQGRIVGGGPTDPQQAAELRAKGFQPYSITIPHSDGSVTYVPFSRFDPIAMPLGIAADLGAALDVYQRTGDANGEDAVEKASLALVISLAKQFGSKTYLTGLSNLIEAMNNPQESGQHYVNKTIENFIPFDSLLRQVNPDPYMRDARKVTDAILSQLPGYSQEVPAKYNALGEPIMIRQGITSDIGGDPVDTEFTRMVLDGATPEFLPPSPNIGNGVDLRDITMKDGSNAYEKYQQLAGHISPEAPTIRDTLRNIIQSPDYNKLVDGPVSIRGTKSYALARPITEERAAAMKIVKADPNVNAAVLKARLQVAGALAMKQADPDGAKTQGAALANIGKSFGVDLSGLPGAKQ